MLNVIDQGAARDATSKYVSVRVLGGRAWLFCAVYKYFYLLTYLLAGTRRFH